MKKLTHQLVLGLLSALLVTLSLGWYAPTNSTVATEVVKGESSFVQLYIESGSKASITNAANVVKDGVAGDRLETGMNIVSVAGTGVAVVFPGGAIVRLTPSSSIKILAISSANGIAHQILLLKGEVWASSLDNFQPLDVFIAGGVKVSTDHNAFNLILRDEGTAIFAARDSVRVNIFSSPSAPSFSPSNLHMLNSTLLAERDQLDVLFEKIQPQLEGLSTAALIGNFSYTQISNSEVSKNAWFQLNFQLDRDVRDLALQHIISDVGGRSLAYTDSSGTFSKVHEGIGLAGNFFTLDSQVRQSNTAQTALSYLEDAFYLYTVSRSDAARERMDTLSAYIAQQSGDSVFMNYISEELWKRFDTSMLLTPQDGSLFALKDALRDQLFILNTSLFHLSLDRTIVLLKSLLSDVRSAYTFDSSLTNTLFKKYIQNIHNFFVSYASEITKKPEIVIELDQMLLRLYLSSPLFYKESFFSTKFSLEPQWLNLIQDQSRKGETVQVLAKSKMALLNAFRIYFFDEKIELSDARAVMFALFTGLTSNISTISDTTLVQTIKTEMKNQQHLWQYINSTEYADSAVHGSTHVSRFAVFEKNLKDQGEIESIQKGLLDVALPVSDTTGQTLREIQQIFAKVGVTQLVLSPLLDKDQKQVFIESAMYNGLPFSAIYDRENTLVSDVKVYNQIVLSSAIPLSKIRDIFKSTSSANASAIVSQPVSTVDENRVEKVAKLFIVKKLQDIGLTLTADMVETTDYQSKNFQIFGATYSFDKEPTSLSFSLNLNTNMISGISLHILGVDRKMPGELSMEGFVQAAKTFYENSFYNTPQTNVGL